MKILVVDDSKAMRGMIRRTLRQAGFGSHQVIEANSGEEALKEIVQQAPDVVLCDWNMPVMTGIELLQRLRSSGKQVPFGFVTSESTDEMKKLATQGGASFFLSKPFTVESFQTALAGVIN